MKVMRELLVGMLTTIASIIIVMGGITLSVAQGQPVALFPTTGVPTNVGPPSPTLLAAASPTVLPGLSTATTATLTQTPTPTTTEIIPTNCPPPRGWQQYVVPSGVSLSDLAHARGVTVEQLMEANCLVSQDLMPDIILYVPPLKATRAPTHTEQPDTQTPEPTLTIMQVTPVPCGQPHGWSVYYVQAGDTLYYLGMIFNTTVAELQQANCLGDSSYIYVGQRLYVPISPTETPIVLPSQALPTPHNTNTRAASTTPLPTQTPSRQPTPSFTPTYTATLIPIKTLTFTPTTDPSLTPSNTPVSLGFPKEGSQFRHERADTFLPVQFMVLILDELI